MVEWARGDWQRFVRWRKTVSSDRLLVNDVDGVRRPQHQGHHPVSNDQAARLNSAQLRAEGGGFVRGVGDLNGVW